MVQQLQMSNTYIVYYLLCSYMYGLPYHLIIFFFISAISSQLSLACVNKMAS